MKTFNQFYYGNIWLYLFIAIVSSCCYINTLFGEFVFDDTEAVVKNKDILLTSSIFDAFKNDFWGTDIMSNVSHKSYRPLVILSYRFNVMVAGSELNPLHFHATNIALYVILCLLTIPIFKYIFLKKNESGEILLSSLIFSVHPVHTEVVAGIVGRADLLASILYLLAILLYRRLLRNHWFAVAPVAIIIFAATLCKETAITALGVCFIYDYVHTGVYKRTKRRLLIRRFLVLILSGLLIIYFRLKIMNFEGPNFTELDNPAAFSPSIVTKTLTFNYVYMLNILILVWPKWLCFDWSMGCIPLITDLYDLRITTVIFFWSVIIYVCYRFLKESFCNNRYNSSLMMAMSFIVLPFLPASNLFFKVGFVIAERILLLPSLGFSFLIVYGFSNLSRIFNLHSEKLKLVFYGICVIFFLRTIQRNTEWLTEETLFVSALEVCPLNAKVHYNVGKVAADNNKRSLAIEEYRKAIELNPRYEQAMNNLANLLRDEKKFAEAEVHLRRALQIRPRFAAAWMNLGIVLTNLNRSAEAEQCYLTAIACRKKYPDCYYNLGNLYLDNKRNEDALKAWGQAVLFRPTHTAAWSNMLVLLDSLRQYDQVLELGQNALMHNPTSASIHFSIANTLGKVRQFEKAEKHFLEALNLSPNNALYYSNLGVLYHRWHQPSKAIEMYRKSLQIDPTMKTAENNLRKLIHMQ